MVKGPPLSASNIKQYVNIQYIKKGTSLLAKEVGYLNKQIKKIDNGYHGSDKALAIAWDCFINDEMTNYTIRTDYNDTWYGLLTRQCKSCESKIANRSSYDAYKTTVDPYTIRGALKQRNEDGLSLFMVALIKDRDVVDIINQLSNVSNRYQLREIFTQKAKWGLSPLTIAIMCGRKKEADLILDAFLNDEALAHDNHCIQDLFNEVTYSGFNVLMLAYYYDVVPENLIRLFEKLSIDEQIAILKKTTPNGHNLFMLAAQYHPDKLPTILSQFKVLLKARPDDLAALLSAKNERRPEPHSSGNNITSLRSP